MKVEAINWLFSNQQLSQSGLTVKALENILIYIAGHISRKITKQTYIANVVRV